MTNFTKTSKNKRYFYELGMIGAAMGTKCRKISGNNKRSRTAKIAIRDDEYDVGYSYLSASMGLSFDARTLGRRPKITPTSVENTMATTMAGTLMATGICIT